MDINKKWIYVVIRAAILLLVADYFTGVYFEKVKEITKTEIDFKTDFTKGPTEGIIPKESNSSTLEAFRKDLSPVIDVPWSIIKYKLFSAINDDLKLYPVEGPIVYPKINIIISGQETKIEKSKISYQILEKSIAPEDMFKLELDRTFEYDRSKIYLNAEGKYNFFIRPTIGSYLIIYSLVLTAIYAFLLVVVQWLKIIFLGHPFSEIIKEFREKKS